jgi:hypothetical protein
LAAIRDAINNSGAPVTARLEPQEAIIKSTDTEAVQVKADGKNQVEAVDGFAEAVLKKDATPRENQQLYLRVGSGPPVTIKAGKAGEIKTPIDQACAGVSVDTTGRLLTVAKRDPIQLLTKLDDLKTNLLGDTRFVGRVARARLAHAKGCAVSIGSETERPVDCDLTKIVAELRMRPVDVQTRDELVLTSRRNPPLQLRAIPGHPETNMLEGELEWACSGWRLLPLHRWFGWSDVCFDYPMLKQSWLGVLVTWMLLSLGAPFWYDALKDLLKLRSTLAKKEEDARNDRQKDTSKAATGQ